VVTAHPGTKARAIELRRRGFSYSEISRHLDVSRSMLSGWLRTIELSSNARDQLRAKAHAGTPRPEVRARHARRRAKTRAYWGEGSKTCNDVRFSNSDPSLIRIFLMWSERYLQRPASQVRCTLHLHSGQDPALEQQWWRRQTGIPEEAFLSPS
jgi:hypothetical protein